MTYRIVSILLSIFLLFSLLLSCGKDDEPQTQAAPPTNLQVSAEVVNDGSGLVKFTATADNAIAYYYFYGENTGETGTFSSDGKSEYLYSKSGTNTFTVRVEAAGQGAATRAEKSITIEVTVSYEPPADLIASLTGGSSKNWYWKNTQDGHLGLGPVNTSDASIYSANRDEKLSEGCLYDDVMTFMDNGDGTYGFQLNNKGQTYFQADVFQSATGQVGNGNDQCGSFSTAGSKIVLFRPVESTVSPSTDVTMTISNDGFMSYGAGVSTYEIMSISSSELKVRAIAMVGGEEQAWYHTFGTVSELQEATFTGATGSGNNDVLVWADEFDVDGAPNNGNWTYNIGTGDSGWGNNESQYYTSRPENIIVDDGHLKITAIKEPYEGSAFTSARLLSQGLVDFKYCKLEVRAKLPTGVGTWPAIWMLGANINEVSWPACGEIDIMEHVGRYQDRLYSTIHYPGNSGGNGVGMDMMVNNLSTEFHIYTLDWNSSKIEFAVDGNVWHTISNDPGIPFNQDFFMILNVAMGGNFGGTIDSGFSASTMEVDYIRVYQ